MSFAAPHILYALLLLPPAVLLYAYAARKRRAALFIFAGNEQEDEVSRIAQKRRRRAGLTVLALLFGIIALAGPQYGTVSEEVRQEGVDLMIVLDVSRSMLAEDIVPSRLERARYELNGIMDELTGSRVGIVLFAGEAFMQCPLTTDLGTVRRYLAAADPDLIPAQGTDIGEALRHAANAFSPGSAHSSSDEQRAQAILVISDGEDHIERFGQVLTGIEESGIAVYSVGIGTESGASIPVNERGNPTGELRDRSGQTVRTQLDDSSLRRIARTGAYYPINRPGASLEAFPTALSRLNRSVVQTSEYTSQAQRFQWPLACALLLLVGERLIAYRRESAS